MDTVVASDWRAQMVSMATQAGESISVSERSRNPMLPNNFLDVTDAGFPKDIIVMALQIPRRGVPQELQQYRQMTQVLKWLHVPWDYISQNGGLDGKPNVVGAERIDLGAGQFVAGLSGHYLMFANRQQYEERRAYNTKQAADKLAYKLDNEEETDNGVRRAHVSGPQGPLSIDDLLAYEKELGEEKPRIGRID